LSFAGVSASAGQVIQVVSTAKTDAFSSNNTSFTDITGFSATITPASASNKILVLIHLSVHQMHDLCVKLVRGSTGIYLGDSSGTMTQASTSMAGAVDSDHTPMSHCLMFLDSPSTTASTTYKLQCKSGDATAVFGLNKPLNTGYGSIGYLCASSFTLMEIKG